LQRTENDSTQRDDQAKQANETAPNAATETASASPEQALASKDANTAPMQHTGSKPPDQEAERATAASPVELEKATATEASPPATPPVATPAVKLEKVSVLNTTPKNISVKPLEV
jgi:hypothetical protein